MGFPGVVLLTIVVAAASFAVAVYLRLGRGPIGGDRDIEGMRAEIRTLAERVVAERSILSDRLEGIDSRLVQAQTSNNDLARGIFDSLGDVRRATTSVAEQARQFTSLQDLLRAPKARGGLGEAMLEELLRQVLPPAAYSMQHRFSSGVIVDAVVRAGGRLVPIDAKFPLANYQRLCEASSDAQRIIAERALAADIDKHIRDISSRYIVPDEKTFEFAVMYVPAEGVYAEVLRLSHRRRSLFETAIETRVVPMSPLTMYGYLQTILFGLKCLQIEQNAQEILDLCGRLQQDVDRFADEYDTLGRHLVNAHARYDDGARRLERFRDRLGRAASIVDGDQARIEPSDETRPPLEAVGE
jgi:DNA recombination protein RmuC